MKEVEKAYLAGIVDGEGSICISRTRKKCRHDKSKREPNYTYALYLKVSNTDLPLLEWCKDITGVGSIHKSRDNRPNRTRQAYQWAVCIRQAGEVIKTIYKYMRVKVKQADLALGFLSKKRDKYSSKLLGRGASKAEFSMYEEYRQALGKLNTKGPKLK